MMGVERFFLKSGNGPSGKNPFFGGGMGSDIQAPLLPGPSRHSILNWALPVAPLHSPTPAVSHCLLLSWQLGIRVFSSSTMPRKAKGGRVVCWPPGPSIEEWGSQSQLGVALGWDLGL